MVRWLLVALWIAGCGSDSPPASHTAWDVDYVYGSEQLKAGHWEEAEPALRRTYERGKAGSEHAQARRLTAAMLGYLERRKGRTEESARWYERSLAMGRTYPAVVEAIELAAALRELGRSDEADRVLAEALAGVRNERISVRRTARLSEARLLHEMGRTDDAIELLQETIADFGDVEPFYRPQFFGGLGYILLDAGEPARAIPHFRERIASSRGDVGFWDIQRPFHDVPVQIMLACALRLAGQHDEAGAVEKEVLARWEEARAKGYDPRASQFEPARIPACAPYAPRLEG